MTARCPSTGETKMASSNSMKRLVDVVSKLLGDRKEEGPTAHGGVSFAADLSASVHEAEQDIETDSDEESWPDHMTQEELFEWLEQDIEGHDRRSGYAR